MRTRPALAAAALLLLGTFPARAQDAPATPAWGLSPSDVAVYDEAPVTEEDGRTSLGVAALRTVHGHDLREEGQYRPATTFRGDLPAVLALRLPPSEGPAPVEVAFRVALHETVDLAVRGTVRAHVRDDGLLEAAVTYAFASRAEPDESDWADARDGTAQARLLFDRARRVVTWARVRVAYTLRRWAYPVGEPPTVRVEGAWDLHLRQVRPRRYAEFARDVDAAVDRGLAWLRRRQGADGSFPPFQGWRVGVTSLGLLTLAECGVPREDASVEGALAWLVRQPPPSRTYEQGLALSAVERAYTPPSEEALLRAGRVRARVRDLPPDRRAWCERTAEALLAGAASPGSWGYPSPPDAAVPSDSSNTQYAALGLRAASRLSIPVPEAQWLGLVRHFDATRERRGPRGSVALRREGERDPAPGGAAGDAAARVAEVDGFRYSTRDPRPWASMVCAGIACLELARHELARTPSRRLTPSWAASLDERVLSGWAWLDRHWGVDRHPERDDGDWHLYYLYSLERAGVFSRVSEVGGRDWYFEGAMELILRQAEDGSWEERGADRTVGTCFALLFLKRATAPLTGDDGR